MSDLSDDLTHWCWVLSDGPKSYFTIRFTASETIYHLKEAIKSKNPNIFSDTDAQTLQINKVDLIRYRYVVCLS
jgi:hypothetical protein